jgi:hypothetical protein
MLNDIFECLSSVSVVVKAEADERSFVSYSQICITLLYSFGTLIAVYLLSQYAAVERTDFQLSIVASSKELYWRIDVPILCSVSERKVIENVFGKFA